MMRLDVPARRRRGTAIARAALPRRPLRRRDVASATMIGVLMSATLPARLGEPARAMVLARRTGRMRETFPVLLGHAGLADRAQHRRAGPARRAHRLLDRPLPLAAPSGCSCSASRRCCCWSRSSLAPTRRAPGRLGPGRARDRDRPRRAGQGPHAGCVVFRDPRRGPVAALAQLAAWALQLLGLLRAVHRARARHEPAIGIGAAAAVLFAVNVTAVDPGDAVEHRRLPARHDQRADHRLRRRRRRRARLRRDPAGGRDRDRGRRSGCRRWSARASPGGHAPAGALAPRRCACARPGATENALSRDRAAAARRYPSRDHPERLRDPDLQKPPQPTELPGARHGATAGIDGGDARLPATDDETSSPRPASASSSSTAAWARPWSSSTSPPRTTAGSQGKCHEALVLNRPDVIEGVHASMLEAGAEVRRDRHLPGLAAEARRVGPRRAHARDQHARRPRSPARRPGETRFVAGSIGPTGFLPASDDPTLGDISLPRAGRGLRRAGARPGRGRRRPDHHRDGAGHPRGQGGDLRRPRGVRARPAATLPIQASVSLLPQGGKMLLGTDIAGGADDARRRSTST